jgi:amino acid transporter
MKAIEEIVDKMETAMVNIAFLIMSILAYFTLFKYRKYQKDKFFVFSLSMFPFAYFLLAFATFSYLWAKNDEDAD